MVSKNKNINDAVWRAINRTIKISSPVVVLKTS